MTIQAAPSEQSYAADGVTVIFPVPFPFDTAADLKITSTDASGNILTLSTGFTISGGAGLTGNATFSVAPASGLTITIYDDPARTQPTDYVSLDAFPAESHERALDRVTRIAKRLYQLVQRSVRFPDGDVSTDGVLGSVANRKGKYLFFNAVTGAIEYAVNIINTTLSQSIIAQLLNPQTAAEISAGVLPFNYAYPECCVDRYATNVTPGTTDMTQGWTNAIAVASVNGGTVTCLQKRYLITGTLTIAGPANIDGGNSYASYTLGNSAQIFSATNLPIFRYTVGSRFVRLDNINIVGTVGLGAQNGIEIGYNVGAGAHGIRMRNVNIFNCGLYGIKVINSVAGHYSSLYISGCSNGIEIVNSGGGAVGANRWYNINITNSLSTDIDITATGGGMDSWYGVTVETSVYGIVFSSGVTGQKFYGVHSEGHGTYPCWFKAGSNKNFVDFETVGASEALPFNQAGGQNAWSGNWVVAGVLKDPIAPKCIQRISTLASTVVSGAGLSAYSAASAPTTSGGLLILTQAITQHNTGTKLVVRAWGVSRIGTTGTMIIALFQSGSTTAVEAIQMPAVGGTFYSWSLEHEFTAGTQNNVTTFTVRVGSTTGPDTADAFGQFGGVIASGGISVEEYLPSTG